MSTIKDIVLDAYRQPVKEVPVEEKPQESPAEETPEIEDEEEETSEPVLPEEDQQLRTQKALQILATLEDPKTAGKFIKSLAASLEEQPKSEAVKQSKNIIEELVEELGPENQYLLEPVVKMMTKMFSEREKGIYAAINQIQQQIQTEKLNTEYENFIEKYNVTDDEHTLMKKYSEKIKPNEDVSFKEYLKSLLTIAREENGRKQKKADIAKKSERNQREDKVSQITKSNSPEPSRLALEQSNIRTPKQAVELALKQQLNNFED
jgi:hypothetical protein